MVMMDSLVRSLGLYINDDLDECSSATETYVERSTRRPEPSTSQSKGSISQSREPTKRSTSHTRTNRTTNTTTNTGRTVSRTEAANTVADTLLNSSFTIDGRRSTANETSVNTHTVNGKLDVGRSIANETLAHRSTVTAPAAPAREIHRRPKTTSSEIVERKKTDLSGERRESSKVVKKESSREDKKEKPERVKETQPSITATPAKASTSRHSNAGAATSHTAKEGKSQEKLHASRSEAETKVDRSILVADNGVNTEELLKENRALRKRVERLEKDVLTNRKLAEHYREKRDRERTRAEERCRELETVVDNMRESYEQELDDVREQLAKCAADAAEKVKEAERIQASAVAAARSVTSHAQQDIERDYEHHARSVRGASVREPSIRAPSVRAPPSVRESQRHASVHEPSIRAPSPQTVKDGKHSVHELSIQTDPVLAQLSHHRSTSLQSQSAPVNAISKEVVALKTQLEQREAELSALKLFHEEAPQMSLEELSMSVKTLNAEIGALSASVANSVPLGRPWEAAQAWALEAADPALERCLRLLAGVKGADFAEDPTLVRLALQAWLVICLQRVFDHFLFGLDDTEDVSLKVLFEKVQTNEPLQVASRWRRLTRRHAKVLVSSGSQSSETTADFDKSLDHAVNLLEMDILVGFESLLRFAGAHSPPGVLLEELSHDFGQRISLAVRRTANLATDLAERAPSGCEVFTAAVANDDSSNDEDAERTNQGLMLCGCMENVDEECRRWVGRKLTSRRGTHAGTRTGTIRSRSRTSRGRTATTWADTNIRQWDRDDSDEEYELDSEVEEDEFEEGNENGTHKHASVVCALGFGLRRILKSEKRARPSLVKRRVSDIEELQKERRRSTKAEVETVRSTSYSVSQSLSSQTSSSTETERQHYPERPRNPHLRTDTTGPIVNDGAEAVNNAELLVKTDVLMSSTVEHLQKRFAM